MAACCRPPSAVPLLLIILAAVSCSPLALACGSTPCAKTPKYPKGSPPKFRRGSPPKSPKSGPAIPITLPPITLPPVMPLPSVPLPSIPMPPVTVPPVTVPIIGGGGGGGSSPAPPMGRRSGSRCASPPPPKPKTCPTDTLKFGACLDILGETVKIGDPSVSCCEPLEGIAGLDAALCLCTTIKAKVLDMNIILPLALQVFANTCGKTIPPGFTCP